MPSTVIAGFDYDEGNALLTVTFVSGMAYRYKDVPLAVADGLKSSKSKGIYFNRCIKDRYSFEKVDHH